MVAALQYFSALELQPGFGDNIYVIGEDIGPASPSVSLISGDPGSFEVRLTVATDDSSAIATAIGE